MNPMTRVRVKSHAHHNSRVRVFNHGEHEDVVNEGDLLIVSEGTDVTFEITFKGRDMFALLEQVKKACDLYEENKHYLSQPATRDVGTSAPTLVRKSSKPAFRQRSDDLQETYRRWVSTQRDSA